MQDVIYFSFLSFYTIVFIHNLINFMVFFQAFCIFFFIILCFWENRAPNLKYANKMQFEALKCY